LRRQGFAGLEKLFRPVFGDAGARRSSAVAPLVVVSSVDRRAKGGRDGDYELTWGRLSFDSTINGSGMDLFQFPDRFMGRT